VRIEEEEPVTAASPLVTQIQVPGQLSELAGVRSFVRAFCERLEAPRLASRRLDRLELAVNEAASNIIRHGYAGRPDGRIEIVADASDPGALRIELRHRGEPFDPAAVPAPAFDGTREGGFGVYLIAQTVDDVRYERDETDGSCRTVLTMKRGDGGGGLYAKGDEPGGDSDRAGG
jgi:serine/threonine-protein kinase RsbW